MKRSKTYARAMVLLLMGALAATPAGAQDTPTPDRPMIVSLTDVPDDLRARLADAGITHAAVFPHARAAAVLGPKHAYERVQRWRDVEAVLPDTPFRPYTWQAIETTRVKEVRLGAPPLRAAYSGRNVTVAIVDTGVDTTHPDLGDRVVANYEFSLEELLKRIDQTDGPIETPVGYDPDHAHGTLLAGVVAGEGRAQMGPDDLRGVAYDARIVNLKVVTGEFISLASVLAAFDWMVEHRDDPRFPGGIKVAVAGIGTADEVLALRVVLQRVIDAGILVVFPAGAPMGATASVTYPARHEEIIAVKGACKDAWRARGPLAWAGVETPEQLDDPVCDEHNVMGVNHDPAIDLLAPGVDIWTPHPPQWQTGFYPIYRPDPPGGDDQVAKAHNAIWYSPFVSASLAAAHVAGVLALMAEAAPCIEQADAEQILERTARDVADEGFDEHTGYGMVDALRALDAAEAFNDERCTG